jgi:hypothetical protein
VVANSDLITYNLRAILPLLGEYSDAGWREPRDKLVYSLRSNGQYWAMMLGAAMLGAIYFFIQAGFRITTFKSLIMALAYAWGLLLAIYLMGHGLVALPRRLFRHASITTRLKVIQSQAPRVHEKLEDATDELGQYEYVVFQLRQRKTGTARDFAEWIEDLAGASLLSESRLSVTGQLSGPSVPNVITERYLADLSRKLKRARHKKLRFEDEWNRLVREAAQTQAILDAGASKRLEPFKQSGQSLKSRFRPLTPYMRYILYYRLVPIFHYTLAGFLSLASVVVVWSSMVKSLETKLSLIGWSVVHHPGSDRGEIGLGGQLIAAGWISYMCSCALFSITEVKVWGNRALVHRQTYAESACWYACQVAKLTVPLAYNFITFLPPNIYRQTQFYQFLGKLIVLTPLGDGFQDYVPMLVLLPCIAALFGIYRRVKSVLTFNDVMDDDDLETSNGTSRWREGRALIEREVHATSITASSGTLGLTTRGTLPERYHDNPPSSAHNGIGTSSRAALPYGNVGTSAERVLSGNNEGESSSNFFEDFAQRVRNTFETNDFTFERPKWMGGRDLNGSTQRAESGQNGLRRWFGRQDEGRLRL